VSAGRIVLLVTGCIVALISFALLAGGVFLLWAHTAERDDDGYYATDRERFRTAGYAIRSDDLDLDADGADWLFDEGRLGRIRLEGESTVPGKRLFLGIGPVDDVARYLRDSPHSVLVDFEVDPFRPEYRQVAGSATPGPPETQTFWVARGLDRVEWEVDDGRWAAVVMNADGSRGVAAEVSAGAKTSLVLWAAWISLGLGVLFGALAALLIWLAVRHGVPAEPEGAVQQTLPFAEGEIPAEYPLHFVGTLEGNLSRWLWIVKVILLIPHYVVLAFLWAAFFVVTVIAFFAILFTERYPRGLFEFNVGVLRWTWRVAWYGLGGFATDRYPPFTLRDADYPARLDVPYPERLSRGLVLVKWWLLAIPHYIVIAFFLGPWWVSDWNPPGLIGILAFFAAVVLLVKNRYPESIYELVLGMDRWVARVAVYAALMRDEYPPFRLNR
jgi:hypothetical protein